jgi:outer membrane biosynthesis protein TonB
MDNKQLIHIACEGIVIGSVSLYFAKQLKKANKEIEDLKEIISKNQAANEKRFEVLFNILDSLNSPQQQPQRKIVPQQQQQKKVTIEPKKKPAPIKKKVTPIEEEVIEEPVEQPIEEPVEDEVIDLEEETRTLLEEDVEEDIEA